MWTKQRCGHDGYSATACQTCEWCRAEALRQSEAYRAACDYVRCEKARCEAVEALEAYKRETKAHYDSYERHMNRRISDAYEQVEALEQQRDHLLAMEGIVSEVIAAVDSVRGSRSEPTTPENVARLVRDVCRRVQA